MMGFKFRACRAAQRDLWDYAGERLAEGPLEQVERHLETCASCRREAAQWKKAQDLLESAQSAPLSAARLGWGDLQNRIAADVAAFGPPRPDKSDTRQAVSQLIPSRRALKISLLHPALAGGMALALAVFLYAHRAPQTPTGESGAVSLPAPISATPPAALTAPFGNSPLSALTQNPAAPAPPLPEDANAPQNAKSSGVKMPLAPNRIAAAPRPAPARRAKISPKTAPPETLAANDAHNSQNDGKLKLTKHEPTTEENAPDESEVNDGVIGTLVPVSHDDNNGYY